MKVVLDNINVSVQSVTLSQVWNFHLWHHGNTKKSQFLEILHFRIPEKEYPTCCGLLNDSIFRRLGH